MRIYKAAAIVLVLVLSASPAYACKKGGGHHRRATKEREAIGWQEVLFRGIARVAAADPSPRPKDRPEPAPKADLTAYEGLGSWIDIFNFKPWDNPKGAVRTMAKRGAKSIFLQTSTYGQSGGIYDEEAVDQFLHHAHKRGMKVVAWYVPSFTQQKLDLQRSLRAINYRSPSGERFDSFGLDIEATHVGNIALRNQRLLALSRRIRNAAGPSYPLSAITPDPIASSYWPSFPWKEAADIYDVIVPMGYFTFRAQGFEEVREYTTANIKMIRRETKDKDVPIHVIGGIADDAGPVDLKGFVKASREHEVMGASLYDYPITSRRSWYEMRALDASVAQRRREEAAEELAAAAERARLARKEEREAKEKAKREREERAERERDNKADRKRDEKDSDRHRHHGKKRDNQKQNNDSKNDPRNEKRGDGKRGRREK